MIEDEIANCEELGRKVARLLLSRFSANTVRLMTARLFDEQGATATEMRQNSRNRYTAEARFDENCLYLAGALEVIEAHEARSAS